MSFDQDLSGNDVVKLVDFSIISVRRSDPELLVSGREIIIDDLDSESFAQLVMKQYYDDRRIKETESKHLRVFFHVLGRYRRPETREQEQTEELVEIGTALQRRYEKEQQEKLGESLVHRYGKSPEKYPAGGSQHDTAVMSAPVRPAATGEAEWTDKKNQRRSQLVNKEIKGAISEAEQVELDQLQAEMLAYRRKVAPLPLDDLRKLHQELLLKAGHQSKS